MRTISMVVLACVVGGAAVASTHVGNRSIGIGLALPTGWSADFEGGSTPTLQTQSCATSAWSTATPHFTGGVFDGWAAAAGETCGWRLDLNGPFEVTVDDGAGVEVTAPIDPAPLETPLSPSLDFDNALGAPASVIVIGVAETWETLLEDLGPGSYTATSSSSPSVGEIEAVFEAVELEIEP